MGGVRTESIQFGQGVGKGWDKKAGLSIHHMIWEEEQALKGILYILHGLGEHIERYDAVARAFTKEGYRVHGIDMPGHGRTKGSPDGHIGDVEQTMSIIDRLLEFDHNQEAPRYLVSRH